MKIPIFAQEILLITFVAILTAGDESRSLFDDLIVDKRPGIEGEPSIYDTSLKSNCRNGEVFPNCNKRKQSVQIRQNLPRAIKTPKTDYQATSNSSLFGDLPKQSLSMSSKELPSTKYSTSDTVQRSPNQPIRKRYQVKNPFETNIRPISSGSLLDQYSASNIDTSRSEVSQRRSSKRKFSNGKEDLDRSLAILQKERETLENLPGTIWKQALKKSEKESPKESSERVLNLLANSANKLKSLFSEELNKRWKTQSNRNEFRETEENFKPPRDYDRWQPDTENGSPSSNEIQASASSVSENFVPFIEEVKESRVQDLILALKIIRMIDESKSQRDFAKNTDDEEMELLLAKSLFKRSIDSLDDLTGSQRVALDSFMKIMHGTLKEEDKEQATDSISRIFTIGEIDFAPTVVSKKNRKTSSYKSYKPTRPPTPPTKTPRPIRPPSTRPPSPPPIGPPSTRPPRPLPIPPGPTVGPPSPPVGPPSPIVGPPSPPLAPSRNPATQMDNFFLTESNSNEAPSSDFFYISPGQEDIFIDDGPSFQSDSGSQENVWRPLSSPSRSPEESIRSNEINVQSNPSKKSNRQRNPSINDGVQHNYHYHFFSTPSTIQDQSSREDRPHRALSSINIQSPTSRESSYTSLEADPILNAPPSSRVRPQTVLQESVEQQDPTGRYSSPRQPSRAPPRTYGSPQADPPPRMAYGPPPVAAPPRPSYSPPQALPPQQTYGPPPAAPQAPPMTYGVPQAPRNPPAPPTTRTRVVFLRPNRGKGKGRKKGSLFSAFSVLLDDDSNGGLRDPGLGGFQSDFPSRRQSLRDEYWRNRELLYRQQQEAFELQRLRQEIQLQERQREEVKRGLFKNLLKDGWGGGIKDLMYKGAFALGALSLVPLSTIIGRKKRDLGDRYPKLDAKIDPAFWKVEKFLQNDHYPQYDKSVFHLNYINKKPSKIYKKNATLFRQIPLKKQLLEISKPQSDNN